MFSPDDIFACYEDCPFNDVPEFLYIPRPVIPVEQRQCLIVYAFDGFAEFNGVFPDEMPCKGAYVFSPFPERRNGYRGAVYS